MLKSVNVTEQKTEKVLDERRKNQRRELYSKRLDIYKTYSLYIPQYITKRKDIFSDIYILYISSYISQRKCAFSTKKNVQTFGNVEKNLYLCNRNLKNQEPSKKVYSERVLFKKQNYLS